VVSASKHDPAGLVAAPESADSGPISPLQWGQLLSSAPPPLQPLDGGFVRLWTDGAAAIEQPSLDHHYLALHLGGPKRVQRRGDGPSEDREVALGSLTVVPAGAAFRWQTEGPIAFAHLYVAPRRLERTVRDTFDRDPAALVLAPAIGWTDPLVAALVEAMADPALDWNPDARLARDSWFEALLARLVQRGSNLATETPRARNALAPRTLARVKAHIHDNLAREVTLDDLAAVAGLSRFHLCRAFREMTGLPPHAYLTRARLAAARRLLRGTDLPIGEVALQCGFASPNQFATSFRRGVGVTPTAFRRSA
jgi:AraC family transcriptional regulator